MKKLYYILKGIAFFILLIISFVSIGIYEPNNYTQAFNKQNYNLNKVSNDFCNIYYFKENPYINMILEMVSIYYPIICNDFRYTNNEKLNIYLFSSEKTMKEYLYLDKAPMGCYYKGDIYILSPELWIKNKNHSEIVDSFLKNGPVVHEIVHLILDKKLNTLYPVWFTEGIALYYEEKYIGFKWRDDLDKESNDVCLDKLNENFEYVYEDLAYKKSYNEIKRFVDINGENGLQSIIEELAVNKNFDEIYFDYFKN